MITPYRRANHYYWARCDHPTNQMLKLQARIIERLQPRLLALLPMSSKTAAMWLAGVYMPDDALMEQLKVALDNINERIKI